MRINKTIVAIILCIFGMTIGVSASPIKLPEPIFMGKVKEVTKEEDGTYGILVQGYIKGCEIYPEELISFITKDTKILKNTCIEEEESITFENLNIEVGDSVYLVLNNAMTKSIPPQVSAKKIQLTKGLKE